MIEEGISGKVVPRVTLGLPGCFLFLSTLWGRRKQLSAETVPEQEVAYCSVINRVLRLLYQALGVDGLEF